jgi:hypothetical protein
MKDEDTQAIDLTLNYENLKEENKDKLLIIGEKLLNIKCLAQNEDKNEKETFENGN